MHYRDATVWKKSILLAELVCRAARELPAMERYGLRLQITRSAISVASNIAEGWTRESIRDKANFLAIAHGSLAELHTQVLLARRIGWLSADTFEHPEALIEEVSRMLTALRRGTRRRL